MQRQFRQNKGVDCAYYLGFTHLINPAFPTHLLLQKSHFEQLRYNRSELTSLPCPCGVPAASIAIALDMEVSERKRTLRERPAGHIPKLLVGVFQ
jgi:hypothetical protein